MAALLFAAFLFVAVPQQDRLAESNQLAIELLQARIVTMERQLDRIEHRLINISEFHREGAAENTTEILMYVLLALLGLDKGSYWAKGYIQRRNGKKNNNDAN